MQFASTATSAVEVRCEWSSPSSDLIEKRLRNRSSSQSRKMLEFTIVESRCQKILHDEVEPMTLRNLHPQCVFGTDEPHQKHVL